MKKTLSPHLLLFVLLPILSSIYSQTYIDDTLTIRAILDTNGINEISALDVSDSSEGRVTSLNWDRKKYGSGVYYLKLSTGNNTLIQKTVIIK